MKHAPQLGLIIALAFLVGCSSLERNSYRTVAAISDAVYISMKAYGDSVKTGAVSADKQAQVKKLYEQYQGVMAATEQVVNAYYEAKKTSTENPAFLKASLGQLSALAETLIEVAREYTVKKKGP